MAADTSRVTMLADRLAPPLARRRPLRRLWGLPPWAHLAGLAALLVLLMPVVGTASSFSSDEGAAIVQARSLATGRGWIVPHPLPQVDQDGRHYPLVGSEQGSKGFAPFAKHPAYAVALAGAYLVGGVAAMMLLSVAGLVAAAGLAGALASRFDPVLRRPVIWTVGLASPLFFDGFLVMGHTLGAACAAGATLAAVVAVTERRPAVALAVAPCIAGAVLLRSEAALFAGALALMAIAAARSRPHAPALLVAGAALASAMVARVVEWVWMVRISGAAPSAVHIPDRYDGGGLGGYVSDRLDGFAITWLLPDYDVSPAFSALMLVMVVALAVAAVESRSGRREAGRVLVPAGLAAGAAAGSVIVAPGTVVPGLLMAFPLLLAGMLVLARPLLREAGVGLALGTSALFAVAVIGTQYPSGGTGEWGGRFFALGIPVVVPVLLLALHRHGRVLAPAARRGALAALVACSLALALQAVLTVRGSHRYWTGVMERIEVAGAIAGPGAPVVATWSATPRYAWPILDRRPWLVTSTADVEHLRRSVAELGHDRFIFLSVDLAADRAALAGLEVVWSDGPLDGGRRVLVVEQPGTGR